MTKTGWCLTHKQPLTACGTVHIQIPPNTLVFTPEQGTSNPYLDLSTFSEDERRVFRLLAARVEAGRSKYGPLNLGEDRRDFARESTEERTDALFYDLVEDLRRAYRRPLANSFVPWHEAKKPGDLSCAPDCGARTACDKVGAPGHSLCGIRLCGHPRHHVCSCRNQPDA